MPAVGRVGCRRRTKLRIEIVEECEHGKTERHQTQLWEKPHTVSSRLAWCPGGSRREASESELLTLVADLLTEKGIPDKMIKAAAEAVHNTAGTGTGEDGYQKVWVSQHSHDIARAALVAAVGVLVDGLTP